MLPSPITLAIPVPGPSWGPPAAVNDAQLQGGFVTITNEEKETTQCVSTWGLRFLATRVPAWILQPPDAGTDMSASDRCWLVSSTAPLLLQSFSLCRFSFLPQSISKTITAFIIAGDAREFQTGAYKFNFLINKTDGTMPKTSSVSDETSISCPRPLWTCFAIIHTFLKSCK